MTCRPFIGGHVADGAMRMSALRLSGGRACTGDACGFVGERISSLSSLLAAHYRCDRLSVFAPLANRPYSGDTGYYFWRLCCFRGCGFVVESLRE